MRGTTADNGEVQKVLVNGKEAKSTASNYSQWQVSVAKAVKLTAKAEDSSGNVEAVPHVRALDSF
ncbi:MAG: hypothetical protein U1F81_11230 [Verrucomicrobiaceae bacterium]